MGHALTWQTIHAEECASWRPWSGSVKITDSKGRDWLCADKSSLDVSFGRWMPLESRDACFRIFWREDHVRAIALREATRCASVDMLGAQLRISWRVDLREAGPSFEQRAAELYDRRGMGKR
jgi:hypothetical protein